MEDNRRFTIFAFPQGFKNNVLKLNILFLPRNQNPLKFAIESHPIIPDSPSFANANLLFMAHIKTGLEKFPFMEDEIPVLLNVVNPSPASKNALFTSLANSFNVKNPNLDNTNNNIKISDKAPDPIKKEDISLSVSKYLPFSYRNSFNFVSPKVKNAKIDDSYHCAIRDASKNNSFVISTDEISWGKVFAYALRQPALAKELGMIYETELPIDESYFLEGGWLFIDLNEDSDFYPQQKASVDGIIGGTINEESEGFFIKKYAARIPPLIKDTDRSVFAPVAFPVLFKKPSDIVDPSLKGFDQVFIEASEYDDGFAKIVHSFQPVSHNFLLEESDGFHPSKEMGIRLGWDDEQILIWYMRQMMEDENAGTNKRLDAPIGVFGYKIDVKEKDAAGWNSLNWRNK